jgi:hypothetical protein
MNAWNKLDELTHLIGTQNVLEEMARALSDDKLNETLDFIAKNWGVDFEEE